mmetsp:Transcript_29142/g.64256  ORF Transcript_29142/g.64256 Transcript_29142/m.64256 type:complete len:103 (+) Transcript_29142:79-387(+)
MPDDYGGGRDSRKTARFDCKSLSVILRFVSNRGIDNEGPKRRGKANVVGFYVSYLFNSLYVAMFRVIQQPTPRGEGRWNTAKAITVLVTCISLRCGSDAGPG